MQNISINFLNITNNETTILYNKYNYNPDLNEYLKYNASLITYNNNTNIDDIPLSILEEFNCTYLKYLLNYTLIDEIKINILNNILLNKDIYVFFNVLTYTDNDFKIKVLNYLKDKNKIIINYTTNIEETLLLDYLIIISTNKIIMEGQTKDIIKEEKIIKKLGYNLPFIAELSLGLKYYGIVDDLYLTKESLVNKLWN